MTGYAMHLTVAQFAAEFPHGKLTAITENSECYIGASIFIIVGSYQDCRGIDRLLKVELHNENFVIYSVAIPMPSSDCYSGKALIRMSTWTIGADFMRLACLQWTYSSALNFLREANQFS